MPTSPDIVTLSPVFEDWGCFEAWRAKEIPSHLVYPLVLFADLVVCGTDEALERITRMFLRLHQHPCTLGPKVRRSFSQGGEAPPSLTV